MKTLYLFFASLTLMLVAACSGTVTITTTEDNFTCNVPPVTPSADTTITITATLQVSDQRLVDCEEADIETFTFEIDQPSGEDFSWCKEVHVFFSATGVTEKEVCSTTNVTSSSTKISLSTTSSDVTSMVQKTTINVKVKVTVKETLANQLSCKGKVSFHAKVKK
jgi:hypothetical protein